MNLEFEVNGHELQELRIRSARGFRDDITKILEEASLLAVNRLRQRVPKGSMAKRPQGRGVSGRYGYSRRQSGNAGHRTLYQSIRRGNIFYSPGAAGGGGYYQIDVGFPDPPPQLQFVLEGTRDLDLYAERGNFMAIQKLGEPQRVRPRRRGQEAQTRWLTETQMETSAFISRKLSELDVRSAG